MDFISIIGYITGAGLIYFGMSQGNLFSVFINAHGLVLVVGGTCAAVFVSTPGARLLLALKELKSVFFSGPDANYKGLIQELMRMSERRHKEGAGALLNYVPSVPDKFLALALSSAANRPDADHVAKVLEKAIRQSSALRLQAAAVFSNMGILSPLFGLLGTIIGIVGVLKDITNPAGIGSAMAIAMTTAFYGIFISAFFCTPIANKIKARAQEDRRRREFILAGITDVLSGAIPLEIENHLNAYLEG